MGLSAVSVVLYQEVVYAELTCISMLHHTWVSCEPILVQSMWYSSATKHVPFMQLRECAAVLLMKLLDDQVPALTEGTQLLKALNVLMLKILDNCSR